MLNWHLQLNFRNVSAPSIDTYRISWRCLGFILQFLSLVGVQLKYVLNSASACEPILLVSSFVRADTNRTIRNDFTFGRMAKTQVHKSRNTYIVWI